MKENIILKVEYYLIIFPMCLISFAPALLTIIMMFQVVDKWGWIKLMFVPMALCLLSLTLVTDVLGTYLQKGITGVSRKCWGLTVFGIALGIAISLFPLLSLVFKVSIPWGDDKVSYLFMIGSPASLPALHAIYLICKENWRTQ